MRNRFLLTTVLALFFSPIISAQTNIPAGDVSGNWTKANSPYNINGNIRVPATETLTIEPGVRVIFQGYYYLDIKGKVRAMGVPGDTILFTIKDTTGFHDVTIGNGGWDGIIIYNVAGEMSNSDSSIFTYCKFQYGKSILDGNEWSGETGGGAIYISGFSKVRIRDCVFTLNQSRTSGGALVIGAACQPAIYHSTFIKNKARSGGGAIQLQYASSPAIYGCLFFNNFATHGSGGAIWSHFGKGKILNNIISNNISSQFGGGLYLFSSNEKITGNMIVNNYAKINGGGVKMDDSWPMFFNNNICNNHSGGAGGGIEFWGLCNADFFNNILWGNTEFDGIKSINQIRISGESGVTTPNFFNCIIQGGIGGIPDYTGKFANIIEDDPQFVNPSINTGTDADGLEADWSLSESSPAINQGNSIIQDELFLETDLRGNPRVIHGIIDIGAYETRIQCIIASDIIYTNTSWIADTVKVYGDIIIEDSAKLNIAPGTCVIFQDYYGINVLGTLHACGSNDQPVTFTIIDTAGFQNRSSVAGSWKGIIFDNSQWGANGKMNDNDSSILRYCIVQYVKYFWTGYPNLFGGAISIRYFSKLEISKCTLIDNFSYQGGALCIDMYSNPLVSGNLIYRNIATDRGGGIFINNNSKPTIINNFIANNATDGGGGGISIQAASPFILNNVICNNNAYFGGGLTIGSSKPIFSNNTVCNNHCTQDGSAFCEWDSKFSIYNSIFWGNVSDDEYLATKPIAISNSQNFYHNNIEGGLAGINLPEGVVPGDFAVNINEDPVFANPTEGPGIEYDAIQADWYISDLSPNINKGLPDIGSLLLPYKDIAGNTRVRHEVIDIGAYENQGNPIEIIHQPFGQIRCSGEDVEFNVVVEGTATFQWFKNGDTISTNPTAITNTLVLNSVSRNDMGDFICRIENGYGMLLSHGVFLEVNSPPEILFQTESQWVREDNNIRLEVRARGTEPLDFQWLKNNAIIQGETFPELRIDRFSLQNEGTYKCQVSNMCNTIQSAPITLFEAPQICMVTVDLETGRNLVIWEKNGAAQVSQYNIYRESIVAGQYERIGQLPYDALSVFVDTVADPSKQAWIYKITATDANGIESDIDLCKPHKTIHLITSTNLTTGDIQLSWDPYYGFEYGTYYIYRSPTLSDFTNIYSMSSSTAAYTEANPEYILYYYRVGVQRPDECNPKGTGTKAGSGPYSQSMSNLEDNRFLTGLNEIAYSHAMKIFPNPFNDRTTLKFSNPNNHIFTLKVMDLTGKVVQITNNIAGSEYILERNNLEKGYYILELAGDRIYRERIIIE